jgi:hypothetical protein
VLIDDSYDEAVKAGLEEQRCHSPQTPAESEDEADDG